MGIRVQPCLRPFVTAMGSVVLFPTLPCIKESIVEAHHTSIACTIRPALRPNSEVQWTVVPLLSLLILWQQKSCQCISPLSWSHMVSQVQPFLPLPIAYLVEFVPKVCWQCPVSWFLSSCHIILGMFVSGQSLTTFPPFYTSTISRSSLSCITEPPYCARERNDISSKTSWFYSLLGVFKTVKWSIQALFTSSGSFVVVSSLLWSLNGLAGFCPTSAICNFLMLYIVPPCTLRCWGYVLPRGWVPLGLPSYHEVVCPATGTSSDLHIPTHLVLPASHKKKVQTRCLWWLGCWRSKIPRSSSLPYCITQCCAYPEQPSTRHHSPSFFQLRHWSPQARRRCHEFVSSVFRFIEKLVCKSGKNSGCRGVGRYDGHSDL